MNSRNSVKAIIHQSELDFIQRWIMDYPTLETGGDLFGYWSKEGIPIIEFAIGPGQNAKRTSVSFIQDVSYLRTWGNLVNGMDKNVRHIGAWHSHHTLSLAHPSGGDINTMRTTLESQNIPRFLISIGNINRDSSVSINGFLFINGHPNYYIDCAWDVIEGISPIRKRLNADPELTSVDVEKSQEKSISTTLETIPEIETVEEKNHGQISADDDNVKPSFNSDSYWLKTEGKKFLKQAFDSLSANKQVSDVEILQLNDTRIVLSFSWHGQSIKIIFPTSYPQVSPTVQIESSTSDGGFIRTLFAGKKKIDQRVRQLLLSTRIITKQEDFKIEHLS